MIASLPLALALSAVFVLTGAYALVRWTAAMTGPLPPSRRMAELADSVLLSRSGMTRLVDRLRSADAQTVGFVLTGGRGA